MNSSGAQILGAMEQVRGLFRELSQMLLSADYQMDQAGWKPAFGNAAVGEYSYSVETPELWGPNYLYRIYTSTAHPAHWGVIMVLLSSNRLPERLEDPITEPLVHGLIIRFGSEEAMPGSLNKTTYKLLFPHRHMTNWKADGQVRTLTWTPDDAYRDVKVDMWAVPLVEITDSDALRARVIQGFVASV